MKSNKIKVIKENFCSCINKYSDTYNFYLFFLSSKFYSSFTVYNKKYFKVLYLTITCIVKQVYFVEFL